MSLRPRATRRRAGRRSRAWAAVVGVAAIASAAFVLALVLWILPPRLIEGTQGTLSAAEELAARNAVRATLLQGLGGMILVAGLYFTGKTLRLNREGQITERYSRSVEQLGHASVDVRLGGIFALERIARDSPGDRATIVEILTAFVREHSSVPDPNAVGGRAPTSDPVTTDLQAALTVIGRRETGTDDRLLNLGHTGLHRADLSGGSWAHALFNYSNMSHCTFYEADLEGAFFYRASLEHCTFGRADCRGAHFILTMLRGSSFEGADARRANFTAANLSEARFSVKGVTPARLDGARFLDATLSDADLSGVDLSAVYLTEYQLAEAKTDAPATPEGRESDAPPPADGEESEEG